MQEITSEKQNMLNHEKMSFADKAISFYLNLNPPKLPDVTILNPYKSDEVKNIISNFFYKYFNDNSKRRFIFGINPGRFGGGVTGIAFTDPIALENELDIKNNLKKKPELSCQFIHKVINKSGGPQKFYSNNFFSALFPLALVKDGLNYNYYDSKGLYSFLRPFIFKSLKEQIQIGAKEDLAISLGKKNLLFLNEMNEELKYFKKIIFLEHPRYIMQYKRKFMDNYIDKYLEALK